MPTLDSMEFTARRMLQVLIIVPSRELTIQTVMLAFRLMGGSVNAGVPGNQDNMFNYTGPQGVKVAGVFEEDHTTREVGWRHLKPVFRGPGSALKTVTR